MSILLKNCALVLTQDNGKILKNTDIFIDGENISIIGSKEKADEILDCSNYLVCPGFINSHTHAGMTLLRNTFDDLEFFEWLNSIWEKEKRYGDEEISRGLSLAIQEMINCGTTVFIDNYPYGKKSLEILENASIIPVLAWPIIDEDKTTQVGKPIENAEKIVSKKWRNIVPALGPHAVYSCSTELLEKTQRLSEKYNVFKTIHVAETRKELYFCLKNFKSRIVEYLEKIGFLDNKTLLSHVGWISKRESRILGENKCAVCLNPVSNMKLGVGGVPPFEDFLEYNIPVCVGTDSAVSNNSLNIVESAKFAALVQKHHNWEPSLFSAQQALDTITCIPGEFLEKNTGLKVGRIKEGYLANLVLFDLRKPQMIPSHNPAASIIYSSSPDCISMVFCKGKRIK
ncbi:MAG: amidohydrolase [archaeon]